MSICCVFSLGTCANTIPEQLHYRRHAAAEIIRKYTEVPVVQLVTELGTNGMSSDESEHEEGHGEATYGICSKPWRSKDLVVLLRALDAVHLRNRYQGAFTATPGGWPHFRRDTNCVSSRSAVQGLHTSCYNSSWCNKMMNEFERSELHALDGICELRLPEAIMQYVHCSPYPYTANH